MHFTEGGALSASGVHLSLERRMDINNRGLNPAVGGFFDQLVIEATQVILLRIAVRCSRESFTVYIRRLCLILRFPCGRRVYFWYWSHAVRVEYF